MLRLPLNELPEQRLSATDCADARIQRCVPSPRRLQFVAPMPSLTDTAHTYMSEIFRLNIFFKAETAKQLRSNFALRNIVTVN